MTSLEKEEFCALKAEVQALGTRLQQYSLFAWTAFAVIEGWVVQSRMGPLSLLGLPLILASYDNCLQEARAVRRIAAYIRCRYENVDTAIWWETALFRQRRERALVEQRSQTEPGRSRSRGALSYRGTFAILRWMGLVAALLVLCDTGVWTVIRSATGPHALSAGAAYWGTHARGWASIALSFCAAIAWIWHWRRLQQWEVDIRAGGKYEEELSRSFARTLADLQGETTQAPTGP